MRTSSGPAPSFAAYTLVCTALSDSRRNGLVRIMVTDTTHPGKLLFRYSVRRSPMPPPSPARRC